MCRVLEIHPCGFYAWLKEPESQRTVEDKRLLMKIKTFWMESVLRMATGRSLST